MCGLCAWGNTTNVDMQPIALSPARRRCSPHLLLTFPLPYTHTPAHAQRRWRPASPPAGTLSTLTEDDLAAGQHAAADDQLAALHASSTAANSTAGSSRTTALLDDGGGGLAPLPLSAAVVGRALVGGYHTFLAVPPPPRTIGGAAAAAATARGYEAHLFVHFSSPHSSSSLHPDVVDAGFAHVASPPFGSGPATQVPV